MAPLPRGDFLHSGQRAAPQQFARKHCLLSSRRIFVRLRIVGARQPQLNRHHMLRIESQRRLVQIPKTAQQQARGHHQHQRQRKLCHHQHAPRARLLPEPFDRAPLAFSASCQIQPPCLPRRRQPENYARLRRKPPARTASTVQSIDRFVEPRQALRNEPQQESLHEKESPTPPLRPAAKAAGSPSAIAASAASSAPSAWRTAISRVRALARANSRFATFTQPISSTSATAPDSRISDCRTLPTRFSFRAPTAPSTCCRPDNRPEIASATKQPTRPAGSAPLPPSVRASGARPFPAIVRTLRLGARAGLSEKPNAAHCSVFLSAHGSPRVVKAGRHHPDRPDTNRCPPANFRPQCADRSRKPLPQAVTDHHFQRESRRLILGSNVRPSSGFTPSIAK